jgi:hypothetical protein
MDRWQIAVFWMNGSNAFNIISIQIIFTRFYHERCNFKLTTKNLSNIILIVQLKLRGLILLKIIFKFHMDFASQAIDAAIQVFVDQRLHCCRIFSADDFK